MRIMIGENIKRLRTEKGVTQERLAEAMNVTSASVSKWERGESFPDITMLGPLAFYFDVSLDELMGYDKEKVNEDIERILEEYGKAAMTDRSKAQQIITDAYRDYPNDYQVMDAYMWHIANGYAENDPSVLLDHKEEFLSICEKLIEGCTWERARLDAWNMKAKILHAEGKTDEAIKIYAGKFTNWYQTGGQKSEQLFGKDTPEFLYWVRRNMYELSLFAADKLVKSYFFDAGIPYGEMVKKLESFGDEALRIGREMREAYYLVEARSIFARLHNDLCFRKTRGGTEEDVDRIREKCIAALEDVRTASENDAALNDLMKRYFDHPTYV